MAAYAAHESDSGNPPEHGPGPGAGYVEHVDRRHRDGASYIDSMLAGTADIGVRSTEADPSIGGSDLASPSSVPLS